MGAAIAGSLVGAMFSQDAVLSFSFGLTVAILVVCEIVPKSLGVGYAGGLAPLLAWPIQVLVWALYPVVSFGEWLTSLVAPRRVGLAPAEDEIIALAHLGALHGSILPEEEKWVHGVLRLNDKTAGKLMTPRTVLTTLEGQRTVGDIEKEISSLRHSRIPVTTDEGPDKILGVVLRRNLVNAVLEGRREVRVQDLAQAALFVPASMRGHQLLSAFVEQKNHLAIVVDEYGGTMGVVTLEDVIEAMLGTQIVGELDPHPDMRAYARSQAKKKMK
jgi:CBS domain containing-hemolysin-like protein